MTTEELTKSYAELQAEVATLKDARFQFPLHPTDRRIVNRDLPVVKSVSGSSMVVEINDIEHTIGGGGSTSGTKSATFIVGPASNADSAGYDYTTDGTDDDVQIQAAVDALPATGGAVCLREGTYLLTTGVATSDINITVFGMGSGTILKGDPSWAIDSVLLSLTGDNSHVHDIQFDGNQTNISGTGCRLLTLAGAGSHVSNCSFHDTAGQTIFISGGASIAHCQFYNISTDNGDALNITAPCFDCYFDSTSGYSAYVDGNDFGVFVGNTFESGDNFAGIFILDPKIAVGNYIHAGLNFEGIGINGGTRLVANNVIEFDSCVAGIGIQGAYEITNNYIDFGDGDADSIGIIGAFLCTGNRVLNTGIGIKCNGDASHNYINHCKHNGLEILQDRSTVVGNQIFSIGEATDNTYFGIKIETNIGHCIVTNNVIVGDSVGNDAKYCIEESAGGDYNIIQHNVATGADTAQIHTVGANTISANNITT